MHVGPFGRPSQMAISDGCYLLRLLVLRPQVLLSRGCIRVDLKVVDQKVFKLCIRQAVEAEFPERKQGKSQITIGSPMLLCRAFERVAESDKKMLVIPKRSEESLFEL